MAPDSDPCASEPVPTDSGERAAVHGGKGVPRVEVHFRDESMREFEGATFRTLTDFKGTPAAYEITSPGIVARIPVSAVNVIVQHGA